MGFAFGYFPEEEREFCLGGKRKNGRLTRAHPVYHLTHFFKEITNIPLNIILIIKLKVIINKPKLLIIIKIKNKY